MLLDGGVEQAGIDEIDACWKSCAGKCKSADFVTSDRPRCWHHFEGSCRPGYAAPSVMTAVHMQREQCGKTHTGFISIQFSLLLLKRIFIVQLMIASKNM